MIKAYSKFLNVLETIQKALLTVSVPAMVLIMFYQVIMRYVFHNSPAWSEELVRDLFIFNVMMAAAIAVGPARRLRLVSALGSSTAVAVEASCARRARSGWEDSGRVMRPLRFWSGGR